MRYYLLTFLLIHSACLVKAQTADKLTKGQIEGVVEVGGLVSNVAQTPFWLRTNQYGIVPLGGSAGTLRASVFREYSPTPTLDSVAKKARRKLDWGFGLAIVGNTGPVDLLNTNLNDARQPVQTAPDEP